MMVWHFAVSWPGLAGLVSAAQMGASDRHTLASALGHSRPSIKLSKFSPFLSRDMQQ